MKFTVDAKELYRAVGAVKAAASSKLVNQIAVITPNKVASMGGLIYAEASFSSQQISGGSIAIAMSALDLLQFVDGQIIIDADEKLVISGAIEAELNLHEHTTDMLVVPPYCHEFKKVGKEMFRVLYAMGNDDQTESISIFGNVIGCGDRRSFAGYWNEIKLTDAVVALHPDLPIRNSEFEIGFIGNRVWFKNERLLASMPTWGYTNEFVVKHAWPELGELLFVASKEELLNAAGQMHFLSRSSNVENNDGRCSMRVSEKQIKFVAAGNEVGKGVATIDLEHGGMEFTYGLSTKMLQNTITNLGDKVEAYVIKVGDNDVLILTDGITKHFIAEDPGAR